MIELIPLDYYQAIYNVFVGLLIFPLAFYCYVTPKFIFKKNFNLRLFTFVVLVAIWLLLGLRPISYVFGDMGNYNYSFQNIVNGGVYHSDDLMFKILIEFSAKYLNAEIFFFICLTIYVFCLYISYKRIFSRNWIWPFALSICLFSFYPFAVNGIRNGMATSLFLMAISYSGVARYFILLVGFGIHSSLIIPLAGLVIFKLIKNVKWYVYGWFVCLLVSLLVPSIGDMLISTGYLGEKAETYNNLNLGNEGITENIGFRYDFIIYSLLPICIGLFYIYKLKYSDRFYNEIFSVFITANAIWLLVIRLPYSNRFAYLSWFLYALIIAYPLIKGSNLRHVNRYFSLIMVGQFVFTILFF